MREKFKKLAAFCTVFGLFGGQSFAQSDWPAKPVTIVVPFAAGGNVDTAARIIADQLSVRLGKTFVIENKSGAGGSIGIGAVAKSPADGYTLGVASSGSLFILPHIYKKKLGYDVFKDLLPLAMVGVQPNFIVTHPSIPAKTPKEFIDHLKANPDKYSYGSSGVGSSQHLCMELLAQKTGIKVTHVPYRASNQIMQDLIAGTIHMSCDQISSSLPQVESGKANGIAVTSLERYKPVPRFPAMAETVPGLDVTWSAMVIAPAGIPDAIAKRLTTELSAISKDPEVMKKFEAMSVTPVSVIGDTLVKQLRSDYETWKPVVESAKIPQP